MPESGLGAARICYLSRSGPGAATVTADLEQLLEDGVIDEVLGRLKSGKEADVWLVRHRDEVLAATKAS
jgi:hypothetical protein